MKIERFIDKLGDDVYAFALVCTKNFDSAAGIFARTAAKCEELPDDAEIYDLAGSVYQLCRKAACNDSAETLSQMGLSKKQERLLADFFPKPQIYRAIIHLYFENDLSVEQIAEMIGEKSRYVSEQLDGLGEKLSEELESSYKELCVKLTTPDDLKEKAVLAAKSGKTREFEIVDDPMPKHTWTKKQKIAAIIFAVIVTIILWFVIPIFNAYLDGKFATSSYDEAPSDLIFSYTLESGEASSEM